MTVAGPVTGPFASGSARVVRRFAAPERHLAFCGGAVLARLLDALHDDAGSGRAAKRIDG